MFSRNSYILLAAAVLLAVLLAWEADVDERGPLSKDVCNAVPP